MLDICNCTGTYDNGTAGIGYICCDLSLGPSCLPRTWPLLSFVSDYDHFGVLLQHNSSQIGPTHQVTQKPVDIGTHLTMDSNSIIVTNLLWETWLWRLGHWWIGLETRRVCVCRIFASPSSSRMLYPGHFLSAADMPYSQRSLPPSNLDNPTTVSSEYPNDYHVYWVLKDFQVEGGPIAPAFGQPSLGTQFDTKRTGKITYLIDQNYLERVNLSSIIIGFGKGGSCGLSLFSHRGVPTINANGVFHSCGPRGIICVASKL